MNPQSLAEFMNAVRCGATAGVVAANIVSRQDARARTGNLMAFVELADSTGRLTAVIFSEGLARYRDLLVPGAAALIQVGAELQGDAIRARILSIRHFDELLADVMGVAGQRALERLQGLSENDLLDFNNAAPQKGTGTHPGRAPYRGSPGWREWYAHYIRSEDWAHRRKLVLERCNHLCEACLENKATQIHHLTKDHAGEEFMWELVGVCADCHERLTALGL